jgi:hypothetical protein
MVQFLSRLAARFAVLVPGVIIAYLSVQKIFPFLDKRTPDAIAIFVTYAIAAYVLIPALLRFYRIIRPADHLPLYCVTPDGFASDPLNVGIVATRRQLIDVMERSGWYVADRHSFFNVARMVLAILLGRSYSHAPVSSLYLFGRKQDIAFEIPVGSTPSTRHHVRFWATTFEKKKKLSIRSIHWQHRRAHVFGDELLWVGASSLDVGLTLIRHNFQVSHMIDPNTDRERELVVDQLKAQKLVKSVEFIKLDNPYKLINRVINGSLHSDGQMAIVKLKKTGLSQTPKPKKRPTSNVQRTKVRRSRTHSR